MAIDEDDSSYNSDELSDMLTNLDIDKDFNVWTSFRSSVISRSSVSRTSGGLTPIAEVSDPLEDADIARWKDRLQRTEVYSKLYRPSEDELKELTDLESFLGLGISRSLRKLLFRRKSDSSTGSVDPESSDGMAWNALVHPEASQPASILLKRGPVLWNTKEAELILLTHGLVIATVGDDTKHTKVIKRTFEQAFFLHHVDHVLASSDDSSAWEIVLQDDSEMTFVCATAKQCHAWIDALEIALVHSRMHSRSTTTSTLGWQYLCVHRPAYTMAVTGKTSSSSRRNLGKDVNKLDLYNGYAPLHYAVRNNHVGAVQQLLQAGADPNLPDRENRTPMYYAVRDECGRMMVQTLESAGGETSQMAETEMSGELFGKVVATQLAIDTKREIEAKRQAQEAENKMAENMRLLQQRGEKIDQLGSKATELNDGARNYSDMARQLKEQSKKQNNWFGLM